MGGCGRPSPASIRMDAGSGGGGSGRLRKTESAEILWVASGSTFAEDEINSSDDSAGDDNPAVSLGSRCCGGGSGDDDCKEEEMLHQRLVRTGPRAESMDVEALG